MFGIITIKGNHLSRIEEIIENFEYKNYVKLNSFDSYDKMEEYLFSKYFERAKENKAIKGFWVDENWTYIFDPELVDPIDTTALIQTSEMLDSVIHSFICEQKSETFVYSQYDKIKTREVFYSSNRLVDNIGNKIEEEEIVDLTASISEAKLINFSKELGLNILGNKNQGHFIIGEFDINKSEVNSNKNEVYSKGESNKWWKFW